MTWLHALAAQAPALQSSALEQQPGTACFFVWQHHTRLLVVCRSASLRNPPLCLLRLQDLTVDITVDKVAPTFDPINGLPVEPPSAAQSAVVLKDSFFAGLTALTALRVNIADATLPESFSTQLTGLQQLQLTCANLTSLPCEISELSQLRVLRLRCAAQLQQLPEEVGSMPDLQELQLGELWQPLLLPASLSSHEALTCLHICGCTSYGNEDGDEPAHPYTMVDGLCAASMQSLQQLLLQRCSFPAGLELGGGSLQQLTMKHCRVGSVDLSGATSLQRLRLADVAEMQHIHGVEDLCCLSVLDIRLVHNAALLQLLVLLAANNTNSSCILCECADAEPAARATMQVTITASWTVLVGVSVTDVVVSRRPGPGHELQCLPEYCCIIWY